MVDVPSRTEFDSLAARVTKIEEGGGPPEPPSGVRPARIATVAETIGYNCFPNGQDGSGRDGTNTAEAIIAATRRLTGGTGMGMSCRFYENGSRDRSVPLEVSRELPNVLWTVCHSQGATAESVIEVADALRAARCLDFVSGPNEPNMRLDQGGTALPPDQALAIQRALSNHFRPKQILVASPSVADQGGDYLGAYWGGLLNAACAASDLADGHAYPNSGAPSRDMWRRTGMLTQAGMPLRRVLSETHVGLYNRYPYPDPTDVDYQTEMARLDALLAHLTLCTLLAGAKHYRVKAMQHFSLYDYDGFRPVGLFQGHDPSKPTAIAKAIAAFFKTCTDASPDRNKFKVVPFPVSVRGMPPAWAGNEGNVMSGGGQWMPCQGDDGTDYVILWNEQDDLDFTTRWHPEVSFGGSMSQIEDVPITNPISEDPTPVAVYHDKSSVVVDMGTEVRVLRVRP